MDQSRIPGRRSKYMATQNLFWVLKGQNECGTWGLVQNIGSESILGWLKCLLRFSIRCYRKIRIFWPTHNPGFKCQETFSGGKNIHAIGLFGRGTPHPTTSQIYYGDKTLISKNYVSQTIHKVHSLTHKCFLTATVGNQFHLGKTGGQKVHVLPHVLNTNTWFQPYLGPLKILWFSS